MLSSEASAKKVAFEYLHNIFPEDKLEPLRALLRNGVWHIYGAAPAGDIDNVAHIELCQSNGRVLTVYHDQ